MAKQPKVYVDGMLLTWADTLFFPLYRPVKPKKPKSGISWLMLLAHAATAKIAAERVRTQIDRTAKRTPEVMVKITNKKGAGRGMANIRNHIDYISRNGKCEIEDQTGDLFVGKEDISGLKRYWQITGGRLIEEEEGKFRDALNVILSMAPGTPPEKVKNAAREFLQAEFSGREYVFVLHTDTLHPHVHVCVKTQKTKELKRLNPNREDLQRWREGFAQKLRDNGIAANATARKTRGETKYPLKQAEIHKARRLGFPLEPRKTDLSKTPLFAKKEREAWKTITQALDASERQDDKALAKNVRSFWSNTPFARFVQKLKEAQQGVSEISGISDISGISPLSALPALPASSPQLAPSPPLPIHQEIHHVITTQSVRYQQWRAAACLHQPDHPGFKGGRTAQKGEESLTRVYGMPRQYLALQPRQSLAVLLYPDALHYMGQRTTLTHALRRPNLLSDAIRAGEEDLRLKTEPTTAKKSILVKKPTPASKPTPKK